MGACGSPAYAINAHGLLEILPNLAIVAGGADMRFDRCPLCARAGWDGRWRNIDDLRTPLITDNAPAFGPHRKTPPKAPRRNPDRGLGDTVGRVIKAVTGIEATDGCGCAKRKDLLNRIVPYRRAQREER